MDTRLLHALHRSAVEYIFPDIKIDFNTKVWEIVFNIDCNGLCCDQFWFRLFWLLYITLGELIM